jgi:hypothetical protein
MKLETLFKHRPVKRDDGVPLAMKLSVFGNAVVVLDGRRCWRDGGMNLQRRLGGQQHARTTPDGHGVLQAIATKHTRPGAHQDDVRGAVDVEGRPDPERWFGIGVRENGASAAALERELEARVTPDSRQGSRLPMSFQFS